MGQTANAPRARGAVAVVAGLGFRGLFLRTRQLDLVVRVAGDDELRLDADVSDADFAAIQRRLDLG
ncbi:hypothetical protein [Halobacterium noricense]|uniref:hypothetical protein n=1 Tax=Halobacterium noricense TaxID=223182 RepID=UPI001E37DC4E|nr:hypothetical protein [Halobacterium noricense]UHH25348.1 hypothetical protein LT974_15435 [Halobacterium noricense]